MVSSKVGPSSGSGLSNSASTCSAPRVRIPSSANSGPATNDSTRICPAASGSGRRTAGSASRRSSRASAVASDARIVGAHHAAAARQHQRLDHAREIRRRPARSRARPRRRRSRPARRPRRSAAASRAGSDGRRASRSRMSSLFAAHAIAVGRVRGQAQPARRGRRHLRRQLAADGQHGRDRCTRARPPPRSTAAAASGSLKSMTSESAGHCHARSST